MGVKVLAGNKLDDLPFEQPARLKFIINLRTAKALDFTIPPTILARADD
jgi:putative tryptophan/tyrosine transport system substrate-binding protein